MRSFMFTAQDLREIERDRFQHPHPRVQRKMEVLWLKHLGRSHEDIAAIVRVSRATVQRYLDEFLAGGLERCRHCRWKGQPSTLEHHRLSLEGYFRQSPPRSVREAQQTIEEITGLRRGETQVRQFLKRLGLKPRKVAAIPLPPKKTPEEHAQEQARFCADKLEPRLAEARAGRRDVYFVDAAHFVFAPFLGWVWCFVRLCIRAASGRKRYNVLGALQAVSHKLIRVTNHSYINAESVCALLRALAAASTGLPITVVLDNARYQKCAVVTALAAILRIELLYLPSYSPNLNLIERVWKFVKKESLRSKYYKSYEEFTGAIEGCLEGLGTKYGKQMDTLLTHSFQTFENVLFLAA
jgi:transposase